MSLEKQAPSRKGASGLAFVGIFLVALAIGLFTRNLVPFLLGGLGVGFVAMALVRMVTGEW